MSSENEIPKPLATCPHCGAGALSLQRVVYARWYGSHFITIPNFPSWVCDVCGSLEYDQTALEQVRLVLGREAGATPEAARRAGHSPAQLDHAPHPNGRRPI
jgi:YgiT-type zinc finger domain-containing protein